jgi:hypothetical protein
LSPASDLTPRARPGPMRSTNYLCVAGLGRGQCASTVRSPAHTGLKHRMLHSGADMRFPAYPRQWSLVFMVDRASMSCGGWGGGGISFSPRLKALPIGKHATQTGMELLRQLISDCRFALARLSRADDKDRYGTMCEHFNGLAPENDCGHSTPTMQSTIRSQTLCAVASMMAW